VKVNRHDEQDEGAAALCTSTPDERAASGPACVGDERAAQVPLAALPTSEVDEEAFAALMLDAVGDGARLCDLHGISDHVMNGIHAYAYDFYRQGRLDEAEAFFRFLCLYDFYNADYATGLAAVFQLQERFRQAIDMYGVAMRLSSDDPSPVFYAGQCFLKLGIPEDAVECFEFVLEHGREASMLERARSYLVSIARSGSPPPGSHGIDHGKQNTFSEMGDKA
jgi:type III secretion system low calcium response chaperone LcrH/SycD